MSCAKCALLHVLLQSHEGLSLVKMRTHVLLLDLLYITCQLVKKKPE